MPELPFHILTTPVAAGRQTGSVAMPYDSAEGSIFSTNLELTLKSVLGEKELKNSILLKDQQVMRQLRQFLKLTG